MSAKRSEPTLNLGPLSLERGSILTAEDKCIASVYSWFGIRESDAYGRVFAAAPELYEALKEIVAITDRKHDVWDKARAAIKKAEAA